MSHFMSNLRLRNFVVGLVGLLLTIGLWLGNPLPASATGVYNMPGFDSNTWIVDQAEILSRLTRGELARSLETLANNTGKQVRFVTVHRLDYGETIDTFADQLFQKWFPTPEDQANQVLLVLDNVTNTAALRSSDDLTLLPPDLAESISQETLLVPLRKGNKYNQAFADARDRLVAVLSGEADPGPPVVEETIQTEGTFAKAEDTDDRSATIIVVGFLAAATIIPMATYYLYQVLQS